MVSDDRTVAVYDRAAAAYARIAPAAEARAVLDAFVAALPPGGQVLDLGCGPGRDAGVMAAAGLRVTAWDAAPAMVDLAGQVAGVSAALATFDDLQGLPLACLDGVWANFSLLHAPRDAMPKHLRAIRRALRPGGRLHVAVKTGAGAARDDLGRLYTYWDETALCAALLAAGFAPGTMQRGASPGFDGVVAPWVAVAAHG